MKCSREIARLYSICTGFSYENKYCQRIRVHFKHRFFPPEISTGFSYDTNIVIQLEFILSIGFFPLNYVSQQGFPMTQILSRNHHAKDNAVDGIYSFKQHLEFCTA